MKQHEEFKQQVIEYIKQNLDENYMKQYLAGKKPMPCTMLQQRWEEILQDTWRTEGNPDKRNFALALLDTHKLLKTYAKHKKIPREIVQLTMTMQMYVYAYVEGESAKPFEQIVVHMCEFAYGVPDGKYLLTRKELKKQFAQYIQTTDKTIN